MGAGGVVNGGNPVLNWCVFHSGLKGSCALPALDQEFASRRAGVVGLAGEGGGDVPHLIWSSSKGKLSSNLYVKAGRREAAYGALQLRANGPPLELQGLQGPRRPEERPSVGKMHSAQGPSIPSMSVHRYGVKVARRYLSVRHYFPAQSTFGISSFLFNRDTQPLSSYENTKQKTAQCAVRHGVVVAGEKHGDGMMKLEGSECSKKCSSPCATYITPSVCVCVCVCAAHGKDLLLVGHLKLMVGGSHPQRGFFSSSFLPTVPKRCYDEHKQSLAGYQPCDEVRAQHQTGLSDILTNLPLGVNYVGSWHHAETAGHRHHARDYLDSWKKVRVSRVPHPVATSPCVHIGSLHSA